MTTEPDHLADLDATILARRIWLTTIATGPVLLHFILYVQDLIALVLYGTANPSLTTGPYQEVPRLVAVYFAMLLYGGLFSLPFYLLFRLSLRPVLKWSSGPVQLALVVLTASALTVLPFLAFAWVNQLRTDLSTFALPMAYLAGAWCGILWVIKDPDGAWCDGKH